MNTILFKIGTLIFLAGGTLATFVATNLCPEGSKSCAVKAKNVAMASAQAGDCAKQKAVAGDQCAKSKAAKAAMAKAECAKKQAVVAKSDCPYSKSADTQLVQNSEAPAVTTAQN